MMKFVNSERNVVNIESDNVYGNILIVTEFNRKEITNPIFRTENY